MRLLGKTSCTTAEHMARSTTGKLPSLHSPGWETEAAGRSVRREGAIS